MRSRFRSLTTVVAGFFLAAPCVLHAQATDNPLTVHGYLTQGFGVTDSLPIYGLTRNATADYRQMALVVRYAVDPKNQFVVQLRNRRFANSLLGTAEGEVAVNWAYYHGLFGPLSVKVGKVPVPFGIYNETRAVGTLLPFYRAPSLMYPDGQETETGAVLTYRTDDMSGWSAEVNAHYGDEDFPQLVVTPARPILSRSVLRHRVGGYVWLNTPVNGLRFGAGGITVNAIDTVNKYSFLVNDIRYGVDATRDRGFVRSEFKLTRLGMHGKAQSYYVESGVKVIGGLSVNGLYQENKAFGQPAPPPPGVTYGWAKTSDRAVSLKYAFSPNLVTKLEAHDNSGFNYDTFIPPSGKPGKVKYFLASLALSF